MKVHPIATVALSVLLGAGTVFGGGDYHLTEASPCIDDANSAGLDTDIDGEPRPQGARFDMGADESPYGGICFIASLR